MSQKSKTTPKPSPRNTLFNYFAKNTPKTPQTDEKVDVKKEEKQNQSLTGKKLDFGKRSNAREESSSDEEIRPTKKKRRVESSSDDDNENADNNRIKEEPKSLKRIKSLDDPEDSPKTKSVKASKNEEPAGKESLMAVDSVNKTWFHETLDFLQPGKIRDANKNRPNHPDYDSRTVFVPDQFLKEQTPAMNQWWKLKSMHFDCIFFFKVGKFYELYHSDAIVGVNELGFTFMGNHEFAHSGFPESAYEKMASILVEKGYKVARVEQTENPAMMEERCKRDGTRDKFSKVMKREVCQITDRGTQIFSTGQQKMTTASEANFLLSIAELKKTSTTSRYGICFVDTTIGDFILGEFDDDQQCSRILTLLSHYPPVLVLYERNGKSQNTEKMIKGLNSLKEPLTNDKQMWSASKTLEFLSKNMEQLPELVKEMEEDHLKPKEDSELALKALGGCLWYLQRNLLVDSVLSLASFNSYVPPDVSNALLGKSKKVIRQKNMVLDSVTLSNLNVAGREHSLLSKMDFCCTQFGKRLLLEYLCSPSAELTEICSRQKAVAELYEDSELHQNCRKLLSSLNIDLERSLAQVHQFGSRGPSKDHPENRAIKYENETYGRNKINDFAGVLRAFELLMELPSIFKDSKSACLRNLTQTKEDGGSFIDMSSDIKKFKNAFNIQEALKLGYAVPEKNADPEYDAILEEISDLETELNDYLKEQTKSIGCKLSYFGSDRKRYQVEVPESKLKNVPKSWSLESATKGKNPVKRYRTEETKEFLARMQVLEQRKKNILTDFARRVFENFSKNYVSYKTICALVAKLDVLASLATYARSENIMCMPKVHDVGEAPGDSLLKIENGVHPLMSGDDFIPNGINIPSEGEAFFELITGPNMGGKSTLMRQVALLSIMAQTGSMVPAEKMELSIIDRIFTRLGANDQIMANLSTFLVELNETSLILKHCTHNSLVLLDELGRGTSTYDGTAIAQSVADFLADLKSRTLFSTHYHSLVDNFYGDKRINLGHMACMVENENCEDITKENVTFLYQYVPGSCPKSFGFNAAKLAGINHKLIRRAHEISRKVEAESLKRKIASKILQLGSGDEIKNLMSKLQSCFV